VLTEEVINPHLPSNALPADKRKQAILAARARAGLPLFNPQDALEDERRGLQLKRATSKKDPTNPKSSGGNYKVQVGDEIAHGTTVSPYSKCPEVTFPLILRWYRERAGYSQTGLASMIGVTWRTVHRYERGYNEPLISELVKIAEVLCVTTDELLGRRPTVERSRIKLEIEEEEGA
jgi:DNA-binding XRE family transcriptional regulator